MKIRTYQHAPIDTNEDSRKECIKFVYLADIYKYKKHRYEYNGNFYSNNRYGVAILTENNNFYYNEVMVSPKRITQTTLLKLKNFFTARFKFTNRCRVCISKTLSNRNEPIVQFLTIAGTACGFPLKWTSTNHMLKILSHEYPRVSIGEYSKWKNKRIFQMLRDRGMFVFLQDEEWFENLSLKNERTRKSYVECAIGIIYMDLLLHNYDIYMEYLKKKELGLPRKKYRTKEEQEMDRLKEIEEKKDPTVFLKKDKILGEIEMVNLFKWCLS